MKQIFALCLCFLIAACGGRKSNEQQTQLVKIDTVRAASQLTEHQYPGKVKAAQDVNDFRTMQCFDWFVKEQGEEEKNADDLIKKYKLFGHDPKGLYALNQELLGRVYTAPSLVL